LVCLKLVAVLSALLALTWYFKFGAFRFLHTVQLDVSYDESWTFSNLDSFKLHNLVAPHGSSRCREGFKSTFIVQPAEQKDDVVVHFTFKTSDQEILDDLRAEKSDDSLVIKYPSSDDNPRPRDECIETHTEVHIRQGLSLKDLDIKYIIGEFIIPEPLELTVENACFYLAIASFHGNQFSGRKTNITVDAGSVTGTFALLDELFITARLGSLRATIVPKAADPSAAKPADFRARSEFGMLDIDFFPSVIEPGGVELPPRDYRTVVTSHAGAIAGRYLHGSNTTLETDIGAIKVAVLPVAVPGHGGGDGDDDETFLTTRSARGRVVVALLDPGVAAAAAKDGAAAAAALTGLQSHHGTNTGSVDVQYPAAWQGAVEGASRVGSVRMVGEGLEIVRRSRKGVGMFVEGRKGDEGRASAVCISDVGSVMFAVGGH
jgi:hypothetical protein